ncbi:MAG: glycosyltransferase family 4 protein [Motiliproteus sp.]
MKILTITSLFPNRIDPKHGIFVETRLKHLKAQYPDIVQTVIAPVPWFPFTSERFGAYGRFAKVPRTDQRNGAQIHHPRYLVIPKIGMLFTPFTMALSILLCLFKLRRQGFEYDLIDGHYLYPDGVAIALCQLFLKRPFVLTARGSDLNLISKTTIPRRMIRWSCCKSEQLITVCEALRQTAIEIGISPSHITTLRNGVDLELFSPPTDRQALRNQLRFEQSTLLSAGNLIELKGHHLIIEALQKLANVQLYIAGDGPDLDKLEQLSRTLGVKDRVHFLGRLSQTELCQYYGAADALVLASSREGWANVLLEVMACGTPVIATRVGGTPEVIQNAQVGRLIMRNIDELVLAINGVLGDQLDRHDVRRYAEQFDWQASSKGQRDLFKRILTDAH